MGDGAPLSAAALAASLTEHLASKFEGAEREGLQLISESVAEYLLASLSGAGQSSSMILWLLMSAAYAGKVPQEDIDGFFTEVGIDLPSAISAWRSAKKKSQGGEFSFVLLPGRLTDGDIGLIAQSLFLQSKERNSGA